MNYLTLSILDKNLDNEYGEHQLKSFKKVILLANTIQLIIFIKEVNISMENEK